MNTQQAYINGFVKRAAQYGYNEHEAINILKNANEEALEKNELMQQLADQKTNVPLQALFGGGLPGTLHNLFKDTQAPKEAPSRTPRILGGNLLGSLAGGAAGYGLGTIAERMGLADLSPQETQSIIPLLGTIGGGMLGSGLGAHSFNNKLKEVEEKEKQKLMLEKLLQQK